MERGSIFGDILHWPNAGTLFVKMTLGIQQTPPLEDVWVALDLETTGLSPGNDEIIEIGAVKFRGDEVLDTYQTFVNPGRKLSEFIKSYTGINQSDVDRAPPFSSVAGNLVSFIGSCPLVGHNITFDLGFLGKRGLRLSNPRADTWDMAYVLLPGQTDYSLGALADHLDVSDFRAHRAVGDANATKEVFLALGEKLYELGLGTLAEIQRLASRSSWILEHLISRVLTHRIATDAGPDVSFGAEAKVGAGLTGLDSGEVSRRLRSGRPLRPVSAPDALDVDALASLLSEGSPLADAIPGFEARPQQVAMTRAVAEAINNGHRLIVEAGTGVGKSMAYLLPAIMYASLNNRRVVVSTNTINLQEQLLNKDIPALLEALAGSDSGLPENTSVALLKGRANYLCFRRWSHLRGTDSLNDHEARQVAKVLVWLQTTATGDRSELNLGFPAAAAPWERLSAQGAMDCLSLGGPCFLRAAREKAAASHVVVVNHALLMSDLAGGGSLIPPYDVLIVDEAHHLEEEATRQFGFDLSHSRIEEHLRELSSDGGPLNGAVAAFRGSSAAVTRRKSVQDIVEGALALLPTVRDQTSRLFALLTSITANTDSERAGPTQDFRITTGTRAQPDWSLLEVQWEGLDALLSELGDALRSLELSLADLEQAGLHDYDGLMLEQGNVQQTNTELRQRLAECIVQPKPDGIYWITRGGRSDGITLHSAPLYVGESLEKLLYSQKDCVVLTSATLSTNGTFGHIEERTGFADADELLLGSPFDYPNAAKVCVVEDMPEPNSWAYQGAMEQAIVDAVQVANGHSMVLFTSHASLQATASAIRGSLRAHDIDVLAQRVDGTPRQLVSRFLSNPRSVLLGTASFWEGVDLAGDSLELLMVARLPFSVPSEPLFAARSELYENAFTEYALPQAILRLRQGFGRLIRTRSDRGAVVILDRRISSKRYGRYFLDSLPPVTVTSCRLEGLPGEIEDWMGRRR